MSRRGAPETALMKRIRVAVVRTRAAIVTRNNTGFDETRGVRYGLGLGGADLVGMLLGSGRAIALEVKTKTGRVSDEQSRWLAAFRRAGGFACVVRSEQDAIAAIERAQKGESE